jgi:hypothetical protein
MKSYYTLKREYFSKYNTVCEKLLLKLADYCGTDNIIESNKLFFDDRFRTILKELNEEYKNANYLKSGIRTWDMWTSPERWEALFSNLVRRKLLIDDGNDIFTIDKDKLKELKTHV